MPKITEETTLGELDKMLKERSLDVEAVQYNDGRWRISEHNNGTAHWSQTLAEGFDKLIQAVDSAVDR